MGRLKKFKLTEHTSHPYKPSTAAKLPPKRSRDVEHNCYASTKGGATVTTGFVPLRVPTKDANDGKSIAKAGQFAEGDTLGNPDITVAYDPEYLEHCEEESQTAPKRKQRASDNPLRVWLPFRDLYLQEIINVDGRGHNPSEKCTHCSEFPAAQAKFECTDCWGRNMKCHGCILATHSSNPFHRIQEWNGTFFEKISLKSLGLRFQLGHRPGERCPNPQSCANDDFTVIDVAAIHSVGINFCACGASSQSHTVQLLRARLFPATVTHPKTAATFRALNSFEIHSYESKVSPFQFYNALSRLTDNTGVRTPKDRYKSLLVMIREWRYLRMLKRGARGHKEGGIEKTMPGSCAVECPACPIDKKNMPPNWRGAPEHQKFKHALFVGIDANFRMKRKDVSSDDLDPDLGNGFAYFVEEKSYKVYLEEHKNEVEPKSGCSRHNAVDLANATPSPGHSASGVGTIECARHDMKRPCSVGDLQVGERYCNMDYLFYHSLLNSNLECFFVSYDIACQWSIHLRERMYKLDHSFILLNDQIHVQFFVPKFHLPAHISACQTKFSFRYGVGVGRTDGEAPERGWADVNPLAASTKEMGPGSRRDALDGHFGDHNWRKTTRLGRSLLRKFKAAINDVMEHVMAHSQLNSSLPQDLLTKWTKDIEAWEKDRKNPNPLVSVVETPTIAAVRRELADLEAQNAGMENKTSLDERVSPSVLISCGLEIEGDHNALQRKIASWASMQQLYIPGVVSLRRVEERTAAAQKTPLKPYTQSLWLPSNIGSKITFDKHLADIEWKLRIAQAHEALDTLRKYLQIRAHLYQFKDRFVRGQHANTRARGAIDTVEGHIRSAAEEYRAAYKALDSLSTLLDQVEWRTTLLPLEAGDIREMSEADDEHTSEGRRKLSWIWKTLGVVNDTSSDYLRDALRIEWCKSRARSMRFGEEVELLTEEMGRVLRYFTHRREWWLAKSNPDSYGAVTELSPLRREGLRAYASRQAAIALMLKEQFAELWRDVPNDLAKLQSHLLSYSTLPSFDSQPGI